MEGTDTKNLEERFRRLHEEALRELGLAEETEGEGGMKSIEDAGQGRSFTSACDSTSDPL